MKKVSKTHATQKLQVMVVVRVDYHDTKPDLSPFFPDKPAHNKARLKVNCSYMLKSYIIYPGVKLHLSLKPRQYHPKKKFHLV